MKEELKKAILTIKNYCLNTKDDCDKCLIKKTCDKHIYPLEDADFAYPATWKIED